MSCDVLVCRSSARMRCRTDPTSGGLGELGPEELEWLFDERQQVSAPSLELATKAWEAWALDTPESLARLASQPSPLLPCLAPALNAHLGGFPSGAAGLGELDRALLEASMVGDDPGFNPLFWRVANELPMLGFGDLQIASRVRGSARAARLCSGWRPRPTN